MASIAKFQIKNVIQRRSYTNFTFVGPPGSGKGTYASLLIERISNLKSDSPVFISASDVLRNTNIEEVQQHQKHGTLVDCDLVGRVILEKLKDDKNESNNGYQNRIGYFLDGYPRTLEQAKLSENWPSHLQLTYAISINVPGEVCVAKILGRRKCNKCGASINTSHVSHGKFNLPSRMHECTCNTMIHWEKRHDDTNDIAWRRFDDFMKKTKPVIEYFRERDRLIEFTPYCGVDDMHLLEELVWNKVNLS